MPIPQLSADLQSQLDKLNSNVQLSRIQGGEIPTDYAFLSGEGRRFRTHFANTQTMYSIVLFEQTPSLNYENNFARGVINDLGKLALLIDLWVDKRIDIAKLSMEFPELELFQPFSFIHPNPLIEAAWLKVKNHLFTDMKFWDNKDWHFRSESLLIAAKKHRSFETYFPLTSHYNLRFSIDKEKTESWEFYYSICPSYDTSKGAFCVQVSMEYEEAKYFEEVNTALDFYAAILTRIKPKKKWKG